MARVGAEIENAVSGERLTFLETAESSGGELFRADIRMPAGDYVIPRHIHPKQEERFEVVAGSLAVTVRRKRRTAGPGETVVVPIGVPHSYWNAGDGELRVLYENRPALPSEEVFFETYYGLSRAGKVSKRGQMNPLQAAVLVGELGDYIRPAFPPVWVQDRLFALLAPIGRRRGYRSTYPEYATDPRA
jgi:quercetin dioxygenase-like cupin family protein